MSGPRAGRRREQLLFAVVLLAASMAASPAFAYVGPGASLSAIGSVIALFAAVGLALVGFVWYPVKRLRRRLKGRHQKDGEQVDQPAQKGAA